MFSSEWHLVHQESSLVSSCIFKGLTDLRLANITQKGLFYTAFYNLAIGLERLMKLTLIIDHMQANNLTCPKSDYIRGLGHNLTELLSECQKRANLLGIPCDLTFSTAAVKQEILQLLNDYSKGLRYHNLDALTGKSSATDPLSSWNSIIMEIYKNEVSNSRKRKIESQAHFFADAFCDSATVIHHDLDRNLLSLYEFMLTPSVIESASPYAVVHMIEIVNEINKLHFAIADLVHSECQKQGRNTPIIPFVREYYVVLCNSNKYHFKKKRWT
jgi:hypothetical protein